jgi:hypothetical protein
MELVRLVFQGEEDTVHILLKCAETRKWRYGLLCKKWLVINEKLA